MDKVSLNVYEKLAETLNKIPNGFTKAKDGVTHLKILKWIFSEEEADIVSKMKLRAETADQLATRLDIPREGLEDKLRNMVRKGQITSRNSKSGERKYGLMPFIVGIYEEQLDRMDTELVQLMEDYFNGFEENNIFDTEPAIFKVIPINEVIQTDLKIHPYEQVKQIINQAKSWGVRECICKKQQEMIGNPCKYPKSVCLNFSPREKAYEDYRISKPITKEIALELLNEAEKAGLIHCSMNIRSDHYYICNCCTCCCGMLKALNERNLPHAYVKSNYQIHVDEDSCAGCETCVDRCQFNALEVMNEICHVNLERCVGCGVCAITCPEQALSLVPRPLDEHTLPPKDFEDWMIKKAIARNVDPSDLL